MTRLPSGPDRTSRIRTTRPSAAAPDLRGPDRSVVAGKDFKELFCGEGQHGSARARSSSVAGRPRCMAVRVMHVRHMRMLVHEPLVAMPVRMGLAGRIV